MLIKGLGTKAGIEPNISFFPSNFSSCLSSNDNISGSIILNDENSVIYALKPYYFLWNAKPHNNNYIFSLILESCN